MQGPQCISGAQEQVLESRVSWSLFMTMRQGVMYKIRPEVFIRKVRSSVAVKRW